MSRLFVPAIVLLATAASAQNHRLWRDLSEPGYVEWLHAAAVDQSGDVVAVGEGDTPATGQHRGLVSRCSPQGVRLSSQLEAGGLTSHFRDVDLALDGTRQTIGGATFQNPGPTSYTWLEVSGPAGTHGAVLMPQTTGRSILSLNVNEFLFTTTAAAAVKYSGTAVVWTNSGGFETAWRNGLAADANGIVFAVGSDGFAPAVRRIRADGTTDWTVPLPGTNSSQQVYETLTGVVLDGLGAVYVTGSVANVHTSTDVVVAKLDAVTGNSLWNRTFDGGTNGGDVGLGLARSASGDVYVVASARVDVGAFNCVLLRRYGADGALLSEILGPPAGATGWVPSGMLVGEDVWAYGRAPGPSGDVGDSATFVMRCDLALTRSDVHIDDVSLTAIEWAEDGELGPGRGVYVVGRASDPNGSVSRLALRVGTNSVAVCFGDGSGTLCPCGNDSAPGSRAGCLHSLGGAGKLDEDGYASISADTFVLEGSGMPDSSALYFQGSTLAGGGAGITFGDGLRCASGSTPRLGIRQNVGGSSHYPGPGDPSVSFQGAIGTPGTRAYQVWYRNSASFCTVQGFNLTNALSTTWEP